MRLKTFTAASLGDAMASVRAELGEDAVIVSTQNAPPDGVQVIAAVEAVEDDAEVQAAHAPENGIGVVVRALHDHGAPLGFVDRVLDAVLSAGTDDPVEALAIALTAQMGFAPIDGGSTGRPIMLVGPPGAGKTVSVAKLAARERLNDRAVTVITLDTVRAGGADQLKSYGERLKIDVAVAADRIALPSLASGTSEGGMVLIDTTGANPFDAAEIGELARDAEAAGAEPVLVLPAGLDPLESAEIAEAFAAIGCERFIATRLDTARRHGGLLAAAGGRLKLAEVSLTPTIAEGLMPLTPLAFAQHLLSRLDQPSVALTDPAKPLLEIRA